MVGGDIDDTLSERGAKYGLFINHAHVTQRLKAVMNEALDSNPHFGGLPVAEQNMIREALDMNAHKVSRIVNGDPTYADSWRDISGYARLVERFYEGDAV